MPNLATIAAVLALALPQEKQPPKEPKPPARHAVVVHAGNTTAETGDAAKAMVKKLFLKDLTHWPTGAEAKAYARSNDSEPQASFRKEVLGMSEAELARHWLKQKSMHGMTPPKEVATDRQVLTYVAKNPSAFGIVSAEAAKGAEGVRVLFEF